MDLIPILAAAALFLLSFALVPLFERLRKQPS